MILPQIYLHNNIYNRHRTYIYNIRTITYIRRHVMSVVSLFLSSFLTVSKKFCFVTSLISR